MKKIENLLEPILEEERTYIDELGLEEEYNDIEDIPIDGTDELDFWGKYGWQIRRDYEYIDEKKAVLVHLKELIAILAKSADTKERHRVRKEIEELISDARYFILHKREDIDEANKVLDVMDNVIDIYQSLAEK